MAKFSNIDPRKIKNFESSRFTMLNWHNVIVKFENGDEVRRPLRVTKNGKTLAVTVSGVVRPVKVVAHNVVTPDLTKEVKNTVPGTHALLGITRKNQEQPAQEKPKASKKAATKSQPKAEDADPVTTAANALGVDANQLQALLALLKS